eukprot:731354-Rhodomonas_salina.1
MQAALSSQTTYKALGIVQETCNTGEHHSNGLSESAIGTISERARTMLAQMNVPKKFWPQSVLYAWHTLQDRIGHDCVQSNAWKKTRQQQD